MLMKLQKGLLLQFVLFQFFLDQLFELRRAQANVRSLQLARARVACQEFADRREARFADPAPRRARA